jgi:predicted negative regulator of RcsB-dependent stress response
MEKLQDTYSFIDDYKFIILGVIGGFIALILIISGISTWNSHSKQQNADAMRAVFETMGKTVEAPAEGATTPTDGSVYATQADKDKAVLAAIDTFLADAGGASEKAGRVLRASLMGQSGAGAEAAKEISELVGDDAFATLAPVLYENLGALALKAGQKDQAAQWFGKMKDATAVPYIKAMALIHLGDLANPMLGGNNAGEAVKSYEAALKELPESKDAAAKADLSILARQDAELRLLLTPRS